jgi:mRNA interferase MazF
MSVDALNHGTADLVVVVPLTTRERRSPFHVSLVPPEGGLDRPSFAMCEQARAISIERLIAGPVVRRYGRATDELLQLVESRLRMVLGIPRR